MITVCLMVVGLVPFTARASTIGELPIEKGQEGSGVVVLQQRLADLGYLHFRATGYFGDMTKTALQDFQKRNGLTRTGSLDTDTYVALFAKSAVRAAAGTAISRVTGPRLLATAEAYGALTGWKEIDPIFAEGTRATVQDLYTGYTYEVIRTGGRHHADVQPVGEEALSVYQKCFGGSYTWEKRPAVVEIAGQKYAASVFGYPNAAESAGYSSLEGSICIYFYESTSDIGGIADAEHTTNIYLASAQAGATK
jgi:peptidoglycan hydrolase-like protein with peptidoglycan-binding domain